MPLPPNLPTPADKRLAVRLTPDARRQVVAGHPWVYAESISSLSARGAPGDLAVVFDDKRKFVAIGLYDPGSPIRLKILHRGAPAPIDASFWQGRLDAALERRAPLSCRSSWRRCGRAPWCSAWPGPCRARRRCTASTTAWPCTARPLVHRSCTASSDCSSRPT
jgi:hypothetical protein